MIDTISLSSTPHRPLDTRTLAALYAATSLIITVHPAMLDVASCNQFLIMISDLSEVLGQFGAKFEHDFFRFLLTRVNPNDRASEVHVWSHAPIVW
ncbi:MAG: hypothetical protein ACJLUP_14430 [Agrobacterium tumefaciens]